MSPRAHRIVRRLLLAGGIALAVGLVPAIMTWDYIQNDPDFCTSCHIMDDAYDRWADSPHAQVNCHTCHPGDLASNLHQLWVQLTDRPTEVKKHAVVPADICGQCHLGEDSRWPVVGQTAGHALHYGEHGIECVECHAPAIHAFIPTDQMCQKCHPREVVGLSAMQRLHCGSCHAFLAAPERGIVPDDARCAECHGADGSAPRASAWHPDLDCAGCHPVHDDPASTAADPGVEHRQGRALPCTGCHADAAALDMPSGHGCADCHEPHGGGFEEAVCRDCHRPIAAQQPPRDHHACADCHPPHAPDVRPAERCADCHRDDEALAAGTPVEAHRACESCHQPHEAGPPDGPACAPCHTKQTRQAAVAGIEAHRQCAGCHAVHAPESVRACGGCHPDQRQATAEAPRAHRNCATCHPLHGSPRAGIGPCRGCHVEQARIADRQPPEHGRCADCHPPHRPTRPTEAVCAECHPGQRAAVAAEPPAHQRCGTCHAWHAPGLRADDGTCAACHAAQAAGRPGAPFGETHQSCGGCHPGHGTRAAHGCADCHVPAARAVSGAIAAHRDCESCHGSTHQPQAGDRRACVDCHGDPTGVGLHRLDAHRACVDCHGGHRPQIPGAAACTGCHPPEKIPRHPAAARGAQSCHGCHSFRRNR